MKTNLTNTYRTVSLTDISNVKLMIARLSLSLILSFSFYLLSSQVPQGFNYQAVALDGNAPITTALPVRITIQSDPTGGTIFWLEEHSSITPNSSGLIGLVVGSGVRQAASTVETFSAIDWSVTPKYIKTEINYKGAWKTMGAAALWAVPYSMLAKDIQGPLKKLGVAGTTTNLDEALFEVKNKDGQVIFAVYSEGVRIYVDNGAKGAKGGFAIGGFGDAKAPSQNYFVVTPDSARMYLDDTAAKGSKGGFAIGGFDRAKGGGQKLMVISPDSARIYVDETAAKGSKGGFAIGGFNRAKGTVDEFMFMTPENYFVGHSSGQLVSTGKYNSTLGYQSGMSLTTGWNNVFVGYQSGLSTSTGGSNVFIGNSAGYMNSAGYYNILLGRNAGYNNTASSNIFLGDLTGYSNTTGNQNVMIGDWAGYYNTIGAQNVFLGAEAGWYNTTGSYNNFMGFDAGKQNTIGSYNSFIGYEAGFNNTEGQYNTYLGYLAGYSGATATGSNNIFMGAEAGYSNTTGFDNIAIGNKAGRSNIDGTYNVMIGTESGNLNVTGDFNTFLGYKTGEKTTYNWNTMIGYSAGNFNTSGGSQVMVGYQAGEQNTGGWNTMVGSLAGRASGTGTESTYLGLAAGEEATGNRNVFLGRWAGRFESTNSYKLIIESNYDGTDYLNNALIYGDFSTKYFKVNGEIMAYGNKPSGWIADFKNTGGASSNYGLNVTSGTATGTGLNYMIDFNSNDGSWKGSIVVNAGTVQIYNVSDARLKDNISKSGINALKILNDLQVMDYNFSKSPGTKHTGYVAQDVQKVLPEMVIYNERADNYAISTASLIPVLHKAIQEQQLIIDQQSAELQSLKTRLAQIEALLTNSGIK